MSSFQDDQIAALVAEERSAARRTLLQVLLTLVGPILMIITLVGFIAASNFRDYRNARAEASFVQHGRLAIAVAIELQKERGMSAGFLASQGAQFQAELTAQRNATDSVLAGAWNALQTMDRSDLPPQSRDVIDGVVQTVGASLQSLVDRRAGVSALTTDPGQTLGFYTGMIMELITLTDIHQSGLDSPSELELSDNYYRLALVGEFGWRERAAGATGFGSGRFDGAVFSRFVGLQAKQSVGLDRFRQTAPDRYVGLLDDLVNGGVGQRIKDLRNIALASFDTGDTGGITGPDWFATSTAFLTGLGSVRDALAETLLERAQANMQVAWTNMLAITGIQLAVILLSVAIAVWQSLNVTRPLTKLARGIQRLARGITDVWVEGEDRRDMVGLLSRSMVKIAKQGGENTRIRTALTASSAKIMIVDDSGSLLYVNAALEASADESIDYFMAEMDDYDPSGALELMATYAVQELRTIGQDLATMTERQTIEVRFDNRIFDVTLGPVIDAEGRRIGTSTEWREVTATRQIESQLTDMIDAARNGDFTVQLQVNSSQKFLNDVAGGMNVICSEVDRIINELKAALTALSSGDLTSEIDGQYRGDLEELANATNATIQSLRNLVGGVIGTSGSIKERGAGINSTADELARSSEEAAASIEEAAAAMEELSESVTSTANFALEAKNISDEARSGMDRGSVVLNESIEAMEVIKAGSQRITEIVTVIDGISFQTNLLALNAAVEAARAGDAGKGFAVVASEVRALAQRSADAANDIKSLIEESATSVGKGVDLVTKTGESLMEINTLVADMHERMNQITHANSEQSTGVAEISRTINHLDKVVQDNANLAQVGASHAGSLAGHADELATRVQHFKMKQGQSSEAAA